MTLKPIQCATCDNFINRSSRGKTPIYCKTCSDRRKGYKDTLKQVNWKLANLDKITPKGPMYIETRFNIKSL